MPRPVPARSRAGTVGVAPGDVREQAEPLRLDPQFRERQQETEREREQEEKKGLRTWAGEHGMKVGPVPEAEAGAEE